MGDREPTPEEAAFLVSYFGRGPEDDERREPVETALGRLIEEVRADRRQRTEAEKSRLIWEDELLGLLERLREAL
jgi:hypothetical protein